MLGSDPHSAPSSGAVFPAHRRPVTGTTAYAGPVPGADPIAARDGADGWALRRCPDRAVPLARRPAPRVAVASSTTSADRRPASDSRAAARFHATPSAVGQARRFAAETSQSWALPDPLVENLVLVLSEIVSDAARYPMAVSVEVELARHRDSVELQVRAHGSYSPTVTLTQKVLLLAP